MTLDGSGSFAPNGDSLIFTWSGPFGTTSGPKPTVTLPLGNQTITLVVDDNKGGTASDTMDAKVVDTKPPTITSVAATPNTLWPPNNKMVPVRVSASATDNCASAPVCKIISVSSDEAGNGDWQVTGNLTLNLRAKRDGAGDGRVYTITVQCADEAENKSTGTTTVTVPHDQGK